MRFTPIMIREDLKRQLKKCVRKGQFESIPDFLRHVVKEYEAAHA
jgi:hypothetical protein